MVNITEWPCVLPVLPKHLTLDSPREALRGGPRSCGPYLQCQGFCSEIHLSLGARGWAGLLLIGSVDSLMTVFPPFSGRFRSHSTSQSPGMQGAAAHPHPVLVHGRPRALHHSVSGLLQEHPRHHPGQEWTGAGGRSLDPEDSLSVHPRGIQFDPTPVNRHISVTGACSGVSYPKVRFSVMSTGINSWRADEIWRWKGDLRGHSPAFLSPYEKTESQWVRSGPGGNSAHGSSHSVVERKPLCDQQRFQEPWYHWTHVCLISQQGSRLCLGFLSWLNILIQAPSTERVGEGLGDTGNFKYGLWPQSALCPIWLSQQHRNNIQTRWHRPQLEYKSFPLRLREGSEGCGLRSPPYGGRDWPVPRKVNLVQARYNLTQVTKAFFSSPV